MNTPIALIAPNKDEVSETFIEAHRKLLDGEIHFLHDGILPTKVDGKSFRKPSFQTGLWKLLPTFIYNRIKEYHNLEKSLKNYLERNKIRLVFAEFGIMGAEVLPICKEGKLPLIVHFHGYDASADEVITKYGKRYKELFDYCVNVISVSNKMTGRLIEWGCPPEKILYNPYGPADKFFSVKPDYDKGCLLSVGRFVEKKAPMLTILAFKELQLSCPSAKMIMIGDGPLLGACKWLARAYSLNIQFLGAVASADILSYFNEAFCFVQHSVTAANGDMEGMPVAILEAGAAALPVISTRHAGIPEAVLHGHTGLLVNEGEVDEMASWMIQLFKNRSVCRNMGDAARIHIKSNFSLDKHITKLNVAIHNSLR